MLGLLEIIWLLPGLFLGSFLPWYFFEEPKHIVKNYIAYAAAFLEIISIPFLLRTLVSPWKSITDEYEVKGFNFSELAQSLTLNVTSRVIGFLFRSITLVIGIAAQILLFLFYLAYFIAWILYPGVLVAAIAYFTSTSL
ncbi:hypothetical protein COU78_05175 [Candidatus Peregrinibacteria bacterium CG10_big_fil_rev_8_21_14_0_10_49_24]|nr:MAG: hypothetical protein COV83_01545 [Candidatus Peregrinibacteria bacterium CG11_big_fil_rev_8_21_14_0_20_49_14]PIR50737.1 MAG: hypothetical protein COU78_05175 [Candidatus Peregrinibacteria bacterium CG10_big_fil_rev_8_21_14_0_10_49_24]PJA68218.1 MAG: hypothetical protein CO157_00635 [Candidatus Peregrinibacteria bacterium CG_4_9_14_3_um_filter_49_12]